MPGADGALLQRIAGLGVMSLRSDGTGPVAATDAMLAMLEWTRDNATAGARMLLDRLSAPDAASLDALLRDPPPVATREYALRLPSGHQRVLELRLARSDRRSTEVTLVAQEVTARRLRALQDAHAQKIDALGRLTGAFAHDMNNVLGVVIGNLGCIDPAHPDPKLDAEALEAAQAAATRGAQMVRSLAAFARRQPGQPVRVDLCAHVRGMLQVIRHLVGKDVELLDRLGDTPLFLDLELDVVDVAVTNLVLNAREAMPGGGTLTLACVRDRAAPGEARRAGRLGPRFAGLAVSDTGSGMEDAVRDKALDPYFSTRADEDGAGMGLFQVQHATGLHGGHVVLESRPGSGTTVTLLFPELPEADAGLQGNHAPLPARGVAARPLRVLVVDDEPGMRRLVARLLGRRGHAVLLADGARTARELLAQGGVDVLLSDVVMPAGEDGVALASWALAAQPGLKVVLMTGHAKAAPGTRRAWPLLAKPFTVEELAAAVEGNAGPRPAARRPERPG